MEEKDNIPKSIKEFNKLNHMQLNVGILNSETQFLQMIAIVNNDGTVIHAKNYKYLRIPVRQSDGKIGFVQKESVRIPARRYLEKTIVDGESAWQDFILNQVFEITEGHDVTADSIMNSLGKKVVARMQNIMKSWSKPGNAPITIANKGKDDPLIDTGKLMESIKYEIKEKI
ncbi:hypothetical protein DY138_00700 [Apilactobacillus timberlakei]|uniref:hypothetical protein n=1 Tax=Apilactobacillus timberlakei TaxID=2008380 RepID=UPI0011283ABB|nr:hypothetical protein [Apilactobacillus timberlakei]TPR19988.1 hypothetical protein DY138_00700 [Apilactobacillus timberlakei]TPR21706.1 hypothetical protein DY061_00615 [Apilactobacillus timberlakei]TPR22952.1 hypothetical protein DY083_02435 [Apilactobacillus timberlakei]